MRAFVTGGTGFVGSHLVDGLLAAGHTVTSLVRDPRKAERLFPSPRFAMIRGTLQDRTVLERGVAEADVVFHVAALIAARGRDDFFTVNEGATKLLLDVAAAANSLNRFVHVSTLAAAGPAPRGDALRGGESENPVTHYGASKLAGELAVRGSRVPWTIVRPPTVYGPRDREMLKLFRLAKRGVAPVFGDGNQELSLVYVTDLVDALQAAAIADGTIGGTYYPAHREIWPMREVVTAIHRAVRPDPDATPFLIPIPGLAARAVLWLTGTAARLAGRTTLLSADKANEFLADAWTCSPDALERDTGWVAQTGLATGMERTAAWYREQGWL